MDDLFDDLKNIVSERYLSDDIYIRHAYSRVVDPVLQGVPEIVIRPKTSKEVSEILKLANQKNTSILPRGGGCGEFGGAKPIKDEGIVLDLKRMDEILQLDQENLIVTVEAGVSWAKLNDYLSNYGLYTGCLGPGSGMTASVGGGVSHHSVGGGGCAKYGACTRHVVGLEVVLPTGEIVETASKTNKYTKFPFNRFGNGPDITGLFCGDNGILGVKTKISLKVYPKPQYAAYKTFLMPRKSMQLSSDIFLEMRKRGLDVYDSMYIMDLLVAVGCEYGLFPMWEGLKRKRGIMFYTIEATTEKELEKKGNQLDQLFIEKKATELGAEIEDGNIAKWHYKEQGHWLIAHNLWGLIPGFSPLDAECHTSISSYPSIMKDLETWDMEHLEDMNKVLELTGMRPISGTGPIILIGDNNVELTTGFTSFESYYEGRYHEELRELNIKLWKSMLERITKHGVSWYMMGDILSRLLVDIGAFEPQYFSFLKLIKNTLDPKHILSRGKFNFW
ncbi:MAG: putative D-lactate dehydrogenase (cytochrome) [Promethearchaeota archaeon]|nr:MAG: putative D-lactate dehydrogenase (cytochrome) [Candidatus Lokiarchaeota archaeon]